MIAQAKPTLTPLDLNMEGFGTTTDLRSNSDCFLPDSRLGLPALGFANLTLSSRFQ